MSGTTSDNEWQQVVQRVTTSEKRWHRMTRSDNEWQFWPNFLFSNTMVLVWAVLHFITRLLQTVVIDVFKIYVNLSKSTIVVFLKLSTSYLLFIIKMCFFFCDEKHVLFCIIKRRSQLTISLTCFVIKQKPLVKTVKTHGKFL